MSERLKIGMCYMINPDAGTQGWASINGMAPVWINNISELDSSCVWITNLSYMQFYRARLFGITNVYSDQYFRFRIPYIIKDLALDGLAPEIMTQRLSHIAYKIATYGEKLGVRPNPSERVYQYTHLIRDSLNPSNVLTPFSGSMADKIQDAIDGSTKDNQGSSGEGPSNSKGVSFHFPHGAFTKWLFDQNYPDTSVVYRNVSKTLLGTFGHMDGKKLKGTSDLQARLTELAKTTAIFFKVDIKAIDSSYVQYCDFKDSGKTKRGKKGPRDHLTLPELLHYLSFAKVRITDAVALKAMRIEMPGADGSLQIPEREHSYSRSLFQHCMYSSLCAPIRVGKDYKRSSAIEAYMRSYDRIACSKAAAHLATKGGFFIGAYGYGRVSVYARKGDAERLSNMALALGLIGPLGLIGDGL